MKQEKKLLLPVIVIATAMAALLMASLLIVTERGTCADGAIRWKLTSGGRLTVTGTGALPDYDTENGVPTPFYNRSVVNAVIEDGVTALGDEAFRGCLNLRSVTIPDSVTSIGENAFLGCTNLRKIRLSENHPAFTFENGVLFSRDKTELLFVSPMKSGKTYTAPESVRHIASAAFYGCGKLTSLTLPDGLESIGVMAFSGCAKLETIELRGSAPAFVFENGALYNREKTELLFCAPACAKDGFNAPETVTAVAPQAFYNCKNVTAVTLPDGLVTVGDMAFAGCAKLESVSLPAGVAEIGARAFRACPALKTVELRGDGGDFTYENGLLLQRSTHTLLLCAPGDAAAEISVPEDVATIAEEAFYGCRTLKKLTLPAGLTAFGKNALSGCSGLAEIRFGGAEAQWNALLKDTEPGVSLKSIAVTFS